MWRRLSRLLHRFPSRGISWIVKCYYATKLRDDVLEDLHTLSSEVCAQKVYAGEPASWFRERLNESGGDRIRPGAEHDRDARSRASRHYGDGVGNCVYQGYLLPFQTPRCLLDRFGI